MAQKNLVLLVVTVILLGGAGYLLARHRSGASSPNSPAPVVCENCGTEFRVTSNDKEPVCPNCGAPASVRRLYYRCTECGHTFLAYELDAKKDLIREPNGEWYSSKECQFVVSCPKCSGRAEYVRDVRTLKK
ncbi:MAG: hypothetical protein JW889_10340 [Verrucomicrobia bacterium]|nr:hypothetical protein [Verrucomicrobiota bacterium]